MSQEGKVLERHFVVTDNEAVHFMGAAAPPVLASPSMISWMEYTARDAAGPLLQPGEDTVGIKVDVKHLAATPVGMKVRVVAKLTGVEGRIYTFQVEAFDESEKIGEGIHQRASVSVAKFATRVAAKKDAILHAG